MAKNDIGGKFSDALRVQEDSILAFSVKRTGEGSPLITNFTTQNFAPSQGVTGEVVWNMEDGHQHKITLANWAPAISPAGDLIRSLAPRVRSDCANWAHGEVLAKKMFWNLASFMAGKIAVGILPSPTRYSTETTVRAHAMREYITRYGIGVERVLLFGDAGVEMSMSRDAFSGVLTVFNQWGDYVLESFADSKSKRATAIQDSEVGYL
jgi:hypothetical protein